MSLPSDIAIARNAANGRYNFSWVAADVVFDDTREHEVMSRLVEWRGAWWADVNGTHGSTITRIKNLNNVTKTLAEQGAREALADMVRMGDIKLEAVTVILSPPQSLAGFQVIVNYSVPQSGLPTQKVAVFV